MESALSDAHDKLREELKLLTRQQSLALQNAAYITMDTVATRQYDLRAKRIAEIIKLLNPS